MGQKGAELINMSLNLDTVKDGRGGILTFILDHSLVELNIVMLKAGKKRGEHYHKEFWEYFLVVDGIGVYVTRDEQGHRRSMMATTGTMFKIPPGTPHVVYAIEDMKCVAGLTKQWDSCEEPISICGEEEI